MDGAGRGGIIDAYFTAKDHVHELMGYKPDWVEIPMEDRRGHYWMLTKSEKQGSVVWSEKPLTAESVDAGSEIYDGVIYTQRFLPKFVYRTPTHVMVSVDTRTDGNKFLMIFDADKECTDEKLKTLYNERWLF
jgi:hypothetical protein